MEPIIKLENVSKEFKVLNRREGLKGSLKDLFSRDYKIVKAVNNISMDIMPGEIVSGCFKRYCFVFAISGNL